MNKTDIVKVYYVSVFISTKPINNIILGKCRISIRYSALAGYRFDIRALPKYRFLSSLPVIWRVPDNIHLFDEVMSNMKIYSGETRNIR